MRYLNPQARELHLAAARRLAYEMHAPEADVIAAYEREVEKLSELHGVEQFVGLLAAKHVRRQIATGKFPSPGGAAASGLTRAN